MNLIRTSGFKWRVAFAVWLSCSILSLTLSAQSIDENKIEIVRDTWGIPHVFAPDAQHAAYGLGWAMSEDQFAYIQTFVAMGQGRLGLLWGIEGAAVDFFRAYSGADLRAKQDYSTSLSPELQSVFKAFALALNTYAEKYPDEVENKRLFPVTGEDLVCGSIIIQYAAVGLADALISIRKGEPDSFIVRPVALGSNAFAFQRKATQYDATTLVMNPHVPLYGFLSFYEAQLRLSDGSMIHGAFIAGLPVPMLGVNNQMAWTVTYNWPDLVDIYRIEKGSKRRTIHLDGKDFPIQKHKVRLNAKVKGLSVSISKPWHTGPHGPMYKKKRKLYATRFSCPDPVLAIEQWYRLGKSYSVAEGRDAFREQGLANFNFVAIDAQDNIGYWFNSEIPDRKSGFSWQQTLAGNRSDLIWQNYLPFDSLPQYYNPTSGFLYNTNNSPFFASAPSDNLLAKNFNSNAGYHWNRENNRALRLREILLPAIPVSDTSLRQIKWDTRWPEKGAMTLLVKRILNPQIPINKRYMAAKSVLSKWSFSGDSTNNQAVLALYILNELFEQKKASFVEIECGIDETNEELSIAVNKGVKRMYKDFDTLEIPLSKVQVLRRRDRFYPVAGLPDALNAVYTYQKKKKMQMYIGENFTGWVKFKDGKLLSLQTITPFGSSSHRRSKHYDDQTEMFTKGQLKDIVFDEQLLRIQASRVYNPPAFSNK